MPETLKIEFNADITKDNLQDILEKEKKKFIDAPENIVFDLSSLKDINIYTLSLLIELSSLAKKVGKIVRISNINDEVRDKIKSFNLGELFFRKEIKKPFYLLENLGTILIAKSEDLFKFLSFQGKFLFFFFPYLVKPQSLKLVNLIKQLKRIGYDGVPIILLLSFLVGLTLALQSANQLRQFGANIFIANLVGIGMTREMAPLMTAILMAGRSGSSITSEISAMVVTEEFDALKGMAIEPYDFVIIPKIMAMLLAIPLLTVLSNIMGNLGGFLIGMFYLDLPMEAYLNQLLKALSIKDYFVGLSKSAVFAWLIAVIATHKGLNVGKGSEAVGLATTSSVVNALFAIIIADCFFSLIFYFTGK